MGTPIGSIGEIAVTGYGMGRSIGMKTAFLLLLAVGLSAQTADKQMTCDGKWGGDRARSCKIQEFGLGVLFRALQGRTLFVM